MKNRLLFLPIMFFISILALPKKSLSQSVGVGTNTPDASAALDISNNTKGLLIPRMSTGSINAIANPAKGLLAYDSLTNQLMVNTGTPAAPSWKSVASNVSGWNLTGNSGINPANQFVGNTDNQPLRFRVNNIQAGELNPANGNIAWGLRAAQANTSGFSNIAIGTDALKSNTNLGNLVAIGDSALFSNSTGSSNTAIGSKSLFSNGSGSFNTAAGLGSLFSNTSGSNNTAIGHQSLFTNQGGTANTAIGDRSLHANTLGSFNTSVGYLSLLTNTTGSNNTAVGEESLISNTTGNNNTAIGVSALSSSSEGNGNTAIGSLSLLANTLGIFNTATGFEALRNNSTGTDNTAMGSGALKANTTSQFNTAMGTDALTVNTTGNSNTGVAKNALVHNTTGNNNTALGVEALSHNTTGNSNVAIGNFSLLSATSSSNNTVVGFDAGSNFNMGFNNTLIGAGADMSSADLFNSIAIGQNARCGSSNQVRIGNSATTSVGAVVGFTNLSDGRYKKNIQDGVKGIDFIMKLRPITYQLDVTGLSKKLNERNGKESDEQTKKSIEEKEKMIQSGFVAQEVEQAAKDAGYDFSGVDKPKNENDLYGLRYSEFVVPLVKAFQEQQVIIGKLQKQVEADKAEIPTEMAKQQQMIDELRKQNDDLQKRVLDLEKINKH